MSHHFQSGMTHFNYNSDLSGPVNIHVNEPLNGRVEFEVDGRALLDFVAHWVAGQRISKLEDATTDEILGL